MIVAQAPQWRRLCGRRFPWLRSDLFPAARGRKILGATVSARSPHRVLYVVAVLRVPGMAPGLRPGRTASLGRTDWRVAGDRDDDFWIHGRCHHDEAIGGARP